MQHVKVQPLRDVKERGKQIERETVEKKGHGEEGRFKDLREPEGKKSLKGNNAEERG